MKGGRLMGLVLAFALCMSTALAYGDLPLGSRGEAVKQMQTRLSELGYYEKSIDGDYGRLSQRALKGFQSANGLEPTGEATAEVLEALYSDGARAVPPPPDVEVAAVDYRCGSARQKVTVKNHLDEAIESFALRYITLDAGGRFKPDHGCLPEGFAQEQSAFTDEIAKTVGAGKTGSVSVEVRSGAPVLAVGVSGYRTASGRQVRLAVEQITYCTSEGDVLWPREDPQAYAVMSDGERARANGMMLGYTSVELPFFAQAQYQLPAGDYVLAVTPDSIAHRAGLAAGDVVTAIDGVPGTNPCCTELAKLKLLDGETVLLTYWRNQASHDVPLALFSEEHGQTQPAE